jgi:acetyl esterase
MNPVLWLACRRSRRHTFTPDPTTIDERRATQLRGAEARPLPDDGLAVSDHHVELADRSLPVRIYRPRDATGRVPVHLYLHGGGFFNGSILHSEPVARNYAAGAHCAVASVGYRLAPEHPWPAAPDDAYAALEWLARSADELGVDAARMSIGGVSAGANIAAVTAIAARDRGGPSLVLQLLEIPVTDLTQSQPSMTAFATGYVATRAELAEGNEYYVPDPAQRADPRVSPLFADLAGLPPAYVLTCEYDPLRDDGEAYADRLRAAGVPTELVRARGHIHGSTYATVWYLPSARRYRRLAVDALRRAYSVSVPTDLA